MSKIPKLVIIGAGGFGREVLSWARQSVQFENNWRIKGFIDDNISALDGKNCSAPILGRTCDYEPRDEDLFICAIGTPSVRRRCMNEMRARGGRFGQVFHRSVVIGENVDIGEGVILCPYVVVSANNCLREGVVVNTHSTIDHDVKVGRWTQINLHCDLTGGVTVGEEVFFGSSVCVVPGVTIGSNAIIGAGSVVTRDVAVGTTVYGVPARGRGQGLGT